MNRNFLLAIASIAILASVACEVTTDDDDGTGGSTSTSTSTGTAGEGGTTSGGGGSTGGSGGSTADPCSCCAGYAMDESGTCAYEDLAEASAALWDAIGDCTCGTADVAGACYDPDNGVEDCLNSCTGGADEDPDCMTCTQTGCPNEVGACLNDASCTG